MSDSKPKITLKPHVTPILAGLSDYLKNPANFETIQKQILETFISTCSHSNPVEWAECPKCTDKMLDRRKLLKKLGFKNAGQYMAWKQVHTTIKERYPLVDWAAEKGKLNLITP